MRLSNDNNQKEGVTKKSVEKKNEISPKKGFDATKYWGKVKLKKHPLELQKQMRDEW